jgi:hypothetical protein
MAVVSERTNAPLDEQRQISAFAKLKLAKCASISGLAEIDFLCARRINPPLLARDAWRSRGESPGSLLRDCIFNRGRLPSHAFLLGRCWRFGGPA